MSRRLVSIIGVLTLAGLAAPAWSQVAPPRPEWAKGVRGWGVLEVGGAPGSRPLEQKVWKRGTLVAQDGRDNIYLLEAIAGTVQVWAPNGDKRDEWPIPGWQPTEASPILSGFACDRRGETFVAATRGQVRVFTRDEMLQSFTVPTLVTGVVLARGEILAAHVPVKFGHQEGQDKARQDPFFRDPYLVTRLTMKGEPLSNSLPPDKAAGADALSLGMTQDICIATDDREEAVWVADRHRLYRLRRLSASGSVAAEWTSDTVRAGVAFGGEAPADVAQNLTPKAAAAFRPVQAPMTVRDLVARRGFVFTLMSPHAIADAAVVDVFSSPGEGPLWRIALGGESGTVYGQLAVTDGGFWLFPAVSGTPRWIERPADWVMEQSLGSRAGDGGSENSE